MSESEGLTGRMKKVVYGLLVATFVAVTLSIDAWGAYNLSTSKLVMYIFMAVAIAGGVYKCIALTTIRNAWRERQLLRWAMLIALLLVAWLQSVTFELTFYSQLYGDSTRQKQNVIDITEDNKKEKLEIERRLANRSTKRTQEEISAEIERQLAKVYGRATLGQLTKNCTAKQRYEYRYCEPVRALEAELAAAKKIAEDEARLREIRNGGAWVTTVGEAHGGAALIARTANRFTGGNVETSFVLDMLMLLGLAVVQFFSTVLPYAVFPYKPRTPGASAVSSNEAKPITVPEAVTAKLEAKASGTVDGAGTSDGKINGVAALDGANATSRDDKPVGMPAGLGTVAKVDSGAKPSLLVPPFFTGAAADTSSRALLAPQGIIGPDDIGAFVAQYINFGKGSELAADVYQAYVGVVGLGLAHNTKVFMKAFRRTFPEGVKSRKVGGVIRFDGLQLNAAGQRVLAELRKEKHPLKIAA